MITPSPTSKIDAGLVRGVLGAVAPAGASEGAHIVLSVPNTNYEMHLIPMGMIDTEVGKRLIGTIRAQARRIDVVGTGGQYVEPVYGHPRRVQGTVVRVEAGAVVVDAGVPIHVTPTDPRQKAEQFSPGQFVSFDVMSGATFTKA